MILYTLHCDGPGCLRSVESAFGAGIEMPAGWSEFVGHLKVSNGPDAQPISRSITKHYCWDCREYMREHGVVPETQVLGIERPETPGHLAPLTDLRSAADVPRQARRASRFRSTWRADARSGFNLSRTISRRLTAKHISTTRGRRMIFGFCTTTLQPH